MLRDACPSVTSYAADRVHLQKTKRVGRIMSDDERLIAEVRRLVAGSQDANGTWSKVRHAVITQMIATLAALAAIGLGLWRAVAVIETKMEFFERRLEINEADIKELRQLGKAEMQRRNFAADRPAPSTREHKTQ